MKSGFGGPAKPPGAPPAPAGAPPAPPGAAPPAEGSIAFSKVELPGEAFFRGEGKEKISDRRQGRSREDDPALSKQTTVSKDFELDQDPLLGQRQYPHRKSGKSW